jgi:hypothetical protein
MTKQTGAGALYVAEEVIDRQPATDELDGRKIDASTCRVLLHAVDDAGRPSCGTTAGLSVLARPWDDGYLLHLARCGPCSAGPAAAPAADPAEPGRPAAGMDVRTARGSEQEIAGADALREVLASFDLRRWMFTDLVTVDETIQGAFSHPLTIAPALLVRSPARALTTFLHEQLHWAVDGPGGDAATAEAQERWPEPPSPPAGAHSAASTWLHMAVCALEYESLCELIGTEPAATELRSHRHYSWIYDQILRDPEWFADFLRRHDLRVRPVPPVPRRYCGEEWWAGLV